MHASRMSTDTDAYNHVASIIQGPSQTFTAHRLPIGAPRVQSFQAVLDGPMMQGDQTSQAKAGSNHRPGSQVSPPPPTHT